MCVVEQRLEVRERRVRVSDRAPVQLLGPLPQLLPQRPHRELHSGVLAPAPPARGRRGGGLAADAGRGRRAAHPARPRLRLRRASRACASAARRRGHARPPELLLQLRHPLLRLRQRRVPRRQPALQVPHLVREAPATLGGAQPLVRGVQVAPQQVLPLHGLGEPRLERGGLRLQGPPARLGESERPLSLLRAPPGVRSLLAQRRGLGLRGLRAPREGVPGRARRRALRGAPAGAALGGRRRHCAFQLLHPLLHGRERGVARRCDPCARDYGRAQVFFGAGELLPGVFELSLVEVGGWSSFQASVKYMYDNGDQRRRCVQAEATRWACFPAVEMQGGGRVGVMCGLWDRSVGWRTCAVASSVRRRSDVRMAANSASVRSVSAASWSKQSREWRRI